MSELVPGMNLIAACTEENGEVSCSVEETNRIRALLGLKPLKIDSDKSDEKGAVENFRRQRDKEQKYSYCCIFSSMQLKTNLLF
jgi:hypothetical protein